MQREDGEPRFVVLSGCSGGGKSTLLAELARRGHSVVEEPGRRIVAQEQQNGGNALPWVEPLAFARRAMAMARADLAYAARLSGPVFFDRGLVDAAAFFCHLTDSPIEPLPGPVRQYRREVFFAPPWPELFESDAQRQHDFAEARSEYDRLARAYPALGYTLVELPKTDIAGRADFVLDRLFA